MDPLVQSGVRGSAPGKLVVWEELESFDRGCHSDDALPKI